MSHLNWRRYRSELELLTEEIHHQQIHDASALETSLQSIFCDDPASLPIHLGVPSPVICFLEYLFFRAEGPYSPDYPKYALIISMLFSCCMPLRALIDLNAADAIGNMILNRRGRLKFTIGDGLELDLILLSWSTFGLQPVSRREIFEAILNKASIKRLMEKQDPGLIIRLSEVFPEYLTEFLPHSLTGPDLEALMDQAVPLPSQRRYRRIYEQQISQGTSLMELIHQEEKRILPLHARRNSFLAFLVKQYQGGRCQLCAAGLKAAGETPVTVHHIVPLSEGGTDAASNMLVVCSQHHHSIHQGAIRVHKGDTITIHADNRQFSVEPCRIPINPGPSDSQY